MSSVTTSSRSTRRAAAISLTLAPAATSDTNSRLGRRREGGAADSSTSAKISRIAAHRIWVGKLAERFDLRSDFRLDQVAKPKLVTSFNDKRDGSEEGLIGLADVALAFFYLCRQFLYAVFDLANLARSRLNFAQLHLECSATGRHGEFTDSRKVRHCDRERENDDMPDKRRAPLDLAEVQEDAQMDGPTNTQCCTEPFCHRHQRPVTWPEAFANVGVAAFVVFLVLCLMGVVPALLRLWMMR